jgi:hypothetical protein
MAEAQGPTSMKERQEQTKWGVTLIFTSAPIYLPNVTVPELGTTAHLFTGHCSLAKCFQL